MLNECLWQGVLNNILCLLLIEELYISMDVLSVNSVFLKMRWWSHYLLSVSEHGNSKRIFFLQNCIVPYITIILSGKTVLFIYFSVIWDSVTVSNICSASVIKLLTFPIIHSSNRHPFLLQPPLFVILIQTAIWFYSSTWRHICVTASQSTRPPGCLLCNFFRLTIKNTSNLCIAALLWGTPPAISRGIPLIKGMKCGKPFHASIFDNHGYFCWQSEAPKRNGWLMTR